MDQQSRPGSATGLVSGAGSLSDPWDVEVREYVAMDLDCRVPAKTSIRDRLLAVADDPVHDHYSPCELAPLLARHFVSTFITGNGIALLELTEEGDRYLKEHNA